MWLLLLERATADTALILRMEEQHERIAELEQRVAGQATTFRRTAAPEDGEHLAAALTALAAALDEHMAEEERHLLPIVEQVLTVAEWEALGEASRSHLPKDRLLIQLGFILQGTSPAEQRESIARLPLPARLAWRLLGRRAFVKEYTRSTASPPPCEVPGCSMHILATSGGFHPTEYGHWRRGPIVEHAIDLAGRPAQPRFCYVGTAGGDSLTGTAAFHGAFAGSEVRASHLQLFPLPNVPDVRAHLLAQDVVWVGGGSVANLLAVWRVHGLDEILRECWQAGVVLGGISAGSICWYAGGPTDSYGLTLRMSPPALGFLPYGNGVHYDSEAQRRPLLHSLVADGTLPASHATDDGVGIVYSGTELVEAVADRPGVAAYLVERRGDGTVGETRVEPRLLS